MPTRVGENSRVTTKSEPASPSAGESITEANRKFYDSLWAGVRFVGPERFNTWPLARELVAAAAARLEIGPGMRPRLPLRGTDFVELTPAAAAAIAARGGRATVGSILALPHPGASFDLVCAMDILEHVEDDFAALSEIARVLRPGGSLLFSVPLYAAAWTEFDAAVGHYRRYEPEELLARLARAGFTLERSAVYGMQPKSSRLLRWGLWWIKHRRETAMRWYNRIFMPVALRLQKPLKFEPGLCARPGVDEIVAVARLRA